MDCAALMNESISFSRLQYEEAEARYQLHLSGCLAPADKKDVSAPKSELLVAIAKARENIQQSLGGVNTAGKSSNLSSSQVEDLVKENKNLKELVEKLTASVQSLTLKLNKLEGKAPPADGKPAPASSNATDDDDDDEMDLFGSDDEEEAAEAERIKAERIKAYEERKADKKKPIAKSSLLLDIKPWDDETDMKEVERLVRTIEMDGLIWGQNAKLIPLAYGIKKLQISAVIEDEKVSTDDLEEKITAFEDLVQSMDIAAFNKV